MDKINSLLNDVLGTKPDGSSRTMDDLTNGRGDLAKGAVAGGLAGLLLGTKSGRKLTGNAVKIGGLALVGGLAYKAWKNRNGGTEERSDDTVRDRFLPPEPAQTDALNHHLISAMIAAAKADGNVSAEEWQRIETETEKLDLAAEDRAFIARELAKPLDVGAVAELAQSPEEAAEIYAASLLVIDRHAAAEQGYLAMLAARLGLDPGLVDQLHDQADQVAYV